MRDHRQPAILWWQPTAQTPTLHLHRIRWVDVTGRPSGHIEIPSRHLRLDRPTIEAALTDQLVPHPYPTPPSLSPAGLAPIDDLPDEARLVLDGHTVQDTDLLGYYGLEVVAAVSAQVLGRGPRAIVFFEQTLSDLVRTGVATAVRQHLAQLASASSDRRFDLGWQSQRDDRWQLILRQH